MERQYETVCERNKWLEARISSLLREIELLRDQNSLALEQKVSAEEEARRLREELKVIQEERFMLFDCLCSMGS